MTIANLQTVAELQDLLAAKDFEHEAIAASYLALPPDVKAHDPKWKDDFLAFRQRYELATIPARLKVFPFKAGPVTLAQNVPAQGEWDLTLLALKPSQGLYDRLAKMGGAIDASKMPQPRKGTDTDLEVLKKADKATKAIEKTASDNSPSKNPMPYVLGGAALLTVLLLALRR